jgi:casein kinase 1
MEALALMLIHLLTPNGLSWTRNGVPKDTAQHDRLKRAKRVSRPEDLCRGMPAEFEEFLRYCRTLKFADCPDYAHWVEEFREVSTQRGFPESEEFMWPPPPLPVRLLLLIG